MFILKRDNVEQYQAPTYNQCLVILQKFFLFLWHYPFKYDGWEIIEEVEEEDND